MAPHGKGAKRQGKQAATVGPKFSMPPGFLDTAVPSVVTMGLMGAALGAAYGVFRATQTFQRAPKPTASFSRRIDQDPDLVEQLVYLRTFEPADPEKFNDLLRMLDELITIYGVVQGPAAPKRKAFALRQQEQEHYQVPASVVGRATQLHQAIDRLLHEFQMKIQAWHPKNREVLAMKLMPEVENALEVVREFSENYLYNVRMTFTDRMTRNSYANPY